MPAPSPIRRVHFVEYNAKINTLAITKVFPKHGTTLLAAILKAKGYDVRVYLEGVSDMRFETISRCDLLCLPLFAPAFNKVKELAARLAAERPDLPVVIGGPHAMLYPETVVAHCDYVVRCEGDEALPELIECLSAGGDVLAVKGLSFLRDGRLVSTADRPPPAIPSAIADPELIDGFHEVARGVGRHRTIVNTLQTSRGCAYHCRFCPTPKLFPGPYRNRDIDSTIAEIKLKQQYNDFFFVVDNNFFGNRERSLALLDRLIEENLDVQLMVFARQEIGRDRELLERMAQAGVKCLIVGVESLVDDNLEAFDKKQKCGDVVGSLETIEQCGIHVVATFAFGHEGDDERKARQIVEFARERELSLNVFILHDIELDERKRLLIPLARRFSTYYRRADPGNTAGYDYATGSFVTYFPKHMKPSRLQRCFLGIYRDLYTDRHILGRMFARNAFASVFGVSHGYGIRRLNETVERVANEYYLGYLERLEEGLYDEHGQLIEQRLAALGSLPPPRPLAPQVDHDRYHHLSGLALLPGMARQALHKGSRAIARQAERFSPSRWLPAR